MFWTLEASRPNSSRAVFSREFLTFTAIIHHLDDSMAEGGTGSDERKVGKTMVFPHWAPLDTDVSELPLVSYCNR